METQSEQYEEGYPRSVPPRRTSSGNNFWETNRLLIKGVIIALLILIMLIPSALISNLIKERADRQQEVATEVSRKWAGPQTLTGPILMIPYLENTTANGQTSRTRNIAYFLPDKLDINGNLSTEERRRSLIYNVKLFHADVSLQGSFAAPDFAALNINPDQVLWNEAKLVVGLSDPGGLEDEISLQWNGNSQKLEGGVPENSALPSGISTAVACDHESACSFSITLKAKGSERFYVTPLGKQTTARLKSDWRDPSFDGKYLPNSPAISAKGFSASWKIQQASRAYPQQWVNANQRFAESSFGVKLFQPTDSYAKTERSVKYALLFIGLTFAVFFFIELLLKKQVHPLQYFLVGVALTVFYSLLLSISEYSGFNRAYGIAATATITLIGLYVWSIFKQAKIALGFTLALGTLYAYIFFLIQLQDYALLFGSVGLFGVVALAMYSSRKVDWYQVGKKTVALPS